MRNGSDDDHRRSTAFGPGPFSGVPSVGVPGVTDDDDAFALGDLVAALRRPIDFGPGIDTTVMDAIRLAPAPLVVVAGTAGRRPAIGKRTLVAPAAPLEPTLAAPLPRAWRWFTRPRAVRVTPLGALAAAGIAIAAVFGLRRDAARRSDDVAGSATDPRSVTGEFATVRRDNLAPTAANAVAPMTRARDTVVITRFMLVAPGAKQVALVGDFNDWDHTATPLVRVASHGSRTGVWTIDLPLSAGRHSYTFLVDGERWVADPSRPRAIGDDFGRPSSAVTVGSGSA